MPAWTVVKNICVRLLRPLAAAWRWCANEWRVPYLSARAALLIVALATLATGAVERFGAFAFLEATLAEPAAFALRAATGLAPTVSPRLKIFAFDDKTVASFRKGNFDLGEWERIFAALDQREPRVIIVDKLFDLPGKDATVKDSFRATLAALRTPVVAGSFVSQTEIAGRSELTPGDLGRWAATPATAPSLPTVGRVIGRLPVDPGFAYGAPDELRSAFRGFGHLVYRGDGRVAPIIRYREDAFIAHAAMHAAGSVAATGGRLLVDGTFVTLDAEGKVPVNFPALGALKDAAYSGKALIARALRGGSIDVVEAGDVVLILPAMYTGTTDWVATPIGFIQGGYVIASMLNSVLTGKWLAAVPARGWWIGLALIAGVATGLGTWGAPFWLILTTAVLATGAVGLAGFAFFGTILPWLPASLTLLAGALPIFAERTRGAKHQADELAKELETSQLVQSSFLPRRGHSDDRLRVRGFYQAASAVSGDFWGYWPTKDDVAYVMIGDAVGHGTPAALITAMAYAVTVALEEESLSRDQSRPSPAHVLERLNQVIVRSMGVVSTMTFIVMAFDFKKGTLTYANAGHPWPVVFAAPDGDAGHAPTRKGSSLAGVQSLSRNVSSLGSAASLDFVEGTRPLTPGETILLYTDGLTENHGRGQAAWQRKQVAKTAAQLHTARRPMLDEIVRLAGERFAGSPLADDYTVVTIEVLDATASRDEPENAPPTAA